MVRRHRHRHRHRQMVKRHYCCLIMCAHSHINYIHTTTSVCFHVCVLEKPIDCMYVVIILISVICFCWTMFKKKTIYLLIILVLHKWPNTQSGSFYRPKFVSHSWFHSHTSNKKKDVVWSNQARHRRRQRHNERGKNWINCQI